MGYQYAFAQQSFDLVALLGPGGIVAIACGLFMGLLLMILERSACRDNPMPF